MAQGTIAPFPKHQLFTNAGAPAVGYQLFTYAAGTSTKLATYTDAALTSANTNPIILDAAGRATIFLTAASYKFVLALPADTDPPLSPIWTVDNISAVAPFFQDIDVTGVAGEALSAGEGVFLSDGSGGNTAGRWYKWDADTTGFSTNAGAIGMVVDAIASGATGSIRLVGRVTGLSGLTAGTTYFISATAGALTATPPTNNRAVGVADTTTSLIFGLANIIDASATRSGVINTTSQVLAGQKTFSLGYPLLEAASGSGQYGYIRASSSFNFTTVGNVGTGEDDLMSRTLPANFMATAGRYIHVFAAFLANNDADAKALAFYWNGVQIGSDHAMETGAATITFCDVYIWRTGANTQRIVTNWRNGNGADADHNTATATGAATESGTIIYKFTGESTDNNDITQLCMIETVG